MNGGWGPHGKDAQETSEWAPETLRLAPAIPHTFAPGELIAERFRLERHAGSGGMGAVYRALDLTTGGSVAVKIMTARVGIPEARFAREARLLSQLSHPAVVRYVSHGMTPQGVPYLAMEWLEGEDLAHRLARAGVSVEETLALVRRICTGLVSAHESGITHRDIKPCNLFLVDGRAEAGKLLDFGVAHETGALHSLTREGGILGTVGYMAPEQAMGARDVDARADVFALGCVLFECLTGQAAFRGAHDVAVLAKLLREEPPRVRELRADVPEALDELVASMLAKKREDRPRDAGTVLSALEALGEVQGAPIRTTRRSTGSRRVESEQCIASVILARPRGPAPATLAPHQAEEESLRLLELVQRFGARPVPLRGGQLLLVFGTRPGIVASDQAAQAVRCALRLRALKPGLSIGVATGGVDTTEVSVGAAIDRAAGLLEEGLEQAEGVIIDELTAGLLNGRFELSRGQSGLRVLTELEDGVRARLLLGKPTPCVGRERELGLLEATLTECIEDQVARVLLVTAQPGTGKSRLGREFLEQERSLGRARIWGAAADPISAGSALNLVQRLVNDALRLRDGESPALRHALVRDYVAQLGAAEQEPWLVEFLGELVGATSSAEPSPLLRTARADPSVMREQTRRAFQCWLGLEARRQPLLILLEDLHWADAPSVAWLEDALSGLTEQSLFVLVLARPEVHDHFPQFGRSLQLQEMRLLGLTRRAAERLVRSALPETAPETLARVVELADGNAFYLEELIRHLAEGGTALPETVRTMVQSRLERLSPEARRHLRAASVFGERAWVGGVATLLEETVDAASWFDALAREEILNQRRESRFPGELEYEFRHALLRDAAYAMLTQQDRAQAHELAGEWLEKMGERDPCVLAEHFERSGVKGRARPWLLRAARVALAGGDLSAAVSLARRGLQLDASGIERGELLLVQGHASAWGTQTNLELAREALQLLPPASGSWWFSLALLVFGSSAIGQAHLAEPYLELAQRTPAPQSERIGAYGQAFEVLAVGAVLFGRADIGWSVLRKYQELTARQAGGDYVSEAWLHLTECQLATNTLQDGRWPLERALAAGHKAVSGMQAAGAVSGEATALFHVGVTWRELGAYERAEQTFGESLRRATAVGNVLIEEFSRLVLAVFALRRGQSEQGRRELEALMRSSDANVAHGSQVVRAEALLRTGQAREALAMAQDALHGPGLLHRVTAGLTVARAHAALDQADAGLRVLEGAIEARGPTCFPQLEIELQSLRAELLHRLGEVRGAATAARRALDFARHTAAGFETAELSASFLRRVRLSAELRVLAETWGPR